MGYAIAPANAYWWYDYNNIGIHNWIRSKYKIRLGGVGLFHIAF